jgi:hypothetical protein
VRDTTLMVTRRACTCAQALQVVSEVATHINEAVRASEGREAVLVIQKQFVDGCVVCAAAAGQPMATALGGGAGPTLWRPTACCSDAAGRLRSPCAPPPTGRANPSRGAAAPVALADGRVLTDVGEFSAPTMRDLPSEEQRDVKTETLQLTLFLFNDILVCATAAAPRKSDKESAAPCYKTHQQVRWCAYVCPCTRFNRPACADGRRFRFPRICASRVCPTRWPLGRRRRWVTVAHRMSSA